MDDERRKQFEARLKATPPPAIERLRTFLLDYVADGDSDLLKLEASKRPAYMVEGVEAIEDVLAEPQEPGTLHHLVAYDANRRLVDQTDETAASWLRSLAADLRKWLGAHAPPPRGAAAR
jgi:hypothetical protein